MSYRDIRSSDNLFSKTNRNDRFKQMSKQQQLIEEKKRQIQEKLELQKKKNAEEALKKIQTNDSNSNEKKSLVFSNDGSFLDQFKKLSGMPVNEDGNSPNMISSEGRSAEDDKDNQRISTSFEEKGDEKKPFDCRLDPQELSCTQPPSRPPPPLPPDRQTNYQPPPLHLQQPPPHYLPYNIPPPPPPVPPPPMMPQNIPPPLLPQTIPPPRPMNVQNIPPPPLSIPPPPIPPCYPPPHQFPPRPPIPNLMLPPPIFSSPQVPPENVQQGNGAGLPDRFSPLKQALLDEDDSKDWFQNMHGNNNVNNSPPIMNDQIKIESKFEIKQENGGDQRAQQQRSERKRKSRWSDERDANIKPPIEIVTTVPTIKVTGMSGPMLTKVTRTDPGLLQYALTAYGSTNLDEEDWKKAEENYKVHLLYQEMMAKRAEIEKLREAGKNKYEYDSDEEIDEKGTWEHKLREKEMVATQEWAESLTEMAKGKHHIGDFLPPDELKKFMAKYKAVKGGGEPDLSDYKEYKLGEDNKGFQMLQKLGWSEGQGLGSDGAGRLDPINKGQMRESNEGLGHIRPDDITNADDEYDAYRKRMMLAYRFRPNPLNNPRRPYY